MTKSRIETYIGFCIRAGKIRFGGAARSLKSAELLILCGTAAKNSQSECAKLARKFSCPVVKSNKKTVEELTGKARCKILAITDKSLARAILDNLDGDFTEWEAK